MRRSIKAACCAVALSASRMVAEAQGIQPEAHVETLISRTTAVHVAVGGNVVGGEYLRLALLGAAGARHVGSEWRPSGRVDLVGRFHVDPRREFKREVYVLGGATALMDDGVKTRIRAMVGIGIEGPTFGNWIVGGEAGFGAGARLVLTLKRARPTGR